MSDQRVRWACRRGMLELDLFLLPFFDTHFSGLDEQSKRAFISLLEANDTELQAWLLEQERPVLGAHQQLIRRMIDFRKSETCAAIGS